MYNCEGEDGKVNNTIEKYSKVVEKVIYVVIATMMAALSIIVFSSVISRYFLNLSIAWSEEASRFLFVWLIFLGAIVAFAKNEHLGLDYVLKLAPEKVRNIMVIINDLLVMIALGVLSWGGYEFTMAGVDSTTPALGIPFAMVNVSALISGSLMFLIAVFNLINHIYLIVKPLPKSSGISKKEAK